MEQVNQTVRKRMLVNRVSYRQLAPYLHRHPSTLWRELKKPLTATRKAEFLDAIEELLEDRRNI